MTPEHAREIAAKLAARLMDRIDMARPTIGRPGGLPLLRSDIEADAFAVMTGGLGADDAKDAALPTPCAPDWGDLWERYHSPSLCECYGDSGPCRHCEDGWQDTVDWDHERRTTGYVLELDGKAA